MPPPPRPEIASLHVSPHGGFHAAEWRALAAVIDFSSNVNPFGVSPRVRQALSTVVIERHPDPKASELRAALATRLQLPYDRVIVGNGSLDLIRALAMAYLRPHDLVLVVGPTFGEYRVAAQIMGARVVEIAARAEHQFRPDVPTIADYVATHHPRIAFLCNPNNPTGTYLARDEIVRLLNASNETLWGLDEAFIAFVEKAWSSVDLLTRFENLVVLRSMTKDYAIPGLRLGYALAHHEIIAMLDRVCAPWSVNALAQAAGLAVLNDDEFLRDTLAKIRVATRALRNALAPLGWRVMPSATHFFLVAVGDARAFRATLAARGILVRDCTSFGLPEFVRIATRTPEENARLIAVLREMVAPPSTVETPQPASSVPRKAGDF